MCGDTRGGTFKFDIEKKEKNKSWIVTSGHAYKSIMCENILPQVEPVHSILIYSNPSYYFGHVFEAYEINDKQLFFDEASNLIQKKRKKH